ncbi:antihemorrhagic factor cHLP-B-like [Ambystoma mexicanum]|uniref:antihemorrhagic factor cHLP-B-like n=1 Tax=Ambystoma mexicanum TaxID=8296 RepID=UPI0037E73A66
MKGLLLLGLAVQLSCCWSVSPPLVPIQPLACNDPMAAIAADMTLRQINANRREGYVFSLYRIADAREHFQESSGTVYYLTLDVLETVCHVLSKRSWEDCEVKPLHEAVYGQCKAIMHINRPRRIVHLHNYDCTLQPVPRSRIQMMCPDCPVPTGLDNPKYLEAAQLTLDKFNRESNLTKYFILDSIARASMQWVVGPSYFVEYIIKETNCTKPVADISRCKALSCEFAHTGFCRGSMMKAENRGPEETHASATCDIFEPEAAETEKQKHKESEEADDHHKGDHGHHHHHDHGHDHNDTHGHHHHHDHDHKDTHGHHHHHDHGHDHNDTHGHHHHHDHGHDHKDTHGHHHHHDHDHKDGHDDKHDHDRTHDHDHEHDHNHTHPHDHAHHHDHKHDHNHTHDHTHDHDHDHQHLHQHEHHHHSSAAARGGAMLPKPIGVIRRLPSVDDASARAAKKDASRNAGKPAVLPSFPDRPAASGGARPMPLPWFPQKPAGQGKQPHARPSIPKDPFGEPTILPFPEGASKSQMCPGNAKKAVSLIDSLLSTESEGPSPQQSVNSPK